jgi:hypothetical protein
MYSGGGRYGSNPSGSNGNGDGKISVLGFRIKALYAYIAAAFLGVIVIYFVSRLLSTALEMHFAMAIGVLLLITNVRELLMVPYEQVQRHHSLALMNSMLGGALACAWLGPMVSVLFWVLAVALFAGSIPLAFSRSSAYSLYVQTARKAGSNIRRGIGRF